MNRFFTQEQKDKEVYNTFIQLVSDGKSKMEATYKCMELFGYTTPCSIFNIRKRIESKL